MMLKRIFWRTVKKKLADYTRKHEYISRCYLRHSTAFGPQNPLISDFDTAFFVNVSNIKEWYAVFKNIIDDIKERVFLRNIMENPLVLPATKNTFRLCKKYYAHRSIYPMETWHRVDINKPAVPTPPRHSLPLDHAPEGCLASYITPVLMKQRKHHLFEHALLTRALQKDYFRTGANRRKKDANSFYETLLVEFDIWDQFYKKINFVPTNENIVFNKSVCCDYTLFRERWSSISSRNKDFGEISSLWIYPSTRNDDEPNMALNISSSVSAKMCKKAIETVLKTFHGLKYSLLLGTEQAMIGRINGLSRVSMLEPWLFKYSGLCLLGNESIREKVIEPTTHLIREKFMEFLLYFSFRIPLWENVYPYAMYRLCFTVDHLLKNRQIILDDKILKGVYGEEFASPETFNPRDDTQKLFSFLRKNQEFDLFGKK